MSIKYIGKSGLLNLHLCELLGKKLNIVISARDYGHQEAFQSDTLVWGGRYLIGDVLQKMEGNDKSKFLYISTFIYNEFCDNYQVRKLLDSAKVEEAGGHCLNIPFISEFHDIILEKVATKQSSDYFTYCTQLSDISNAILAFDELGDLSLDKTRVNLKLSKCERVLWKLFSLLYWNTNNVNRSRFKLGYLNAVKAFEKVLHKILFCHGLSAVYIKRDC
jgi:hypothetical protein